MDAIVLGLCGCTCAFLCTILGILGLRDSLLWFATSSVDEFELDFWNGIARFARFGGEC